MAQTYIDRNDEIVALREENERLRPLEGLLKEAKSQNFALLQENGDLKDELRQLRNRLEGDLQSMREQIREEKEKHALAKMRVLETKTESKMLHDSLRDADAKVEKYKAEADEFAQKLRLLAGKYELQSVINATYRKFYAQNPRAESEAVAFDKSVEEAFKDFNQAMQSKDNFIADNMGDLEQMVDKTSFIRSESVRKRLCGDLDKELREEMAAEKERLKLEAKKAVTGPPASLARSITAGDR